MNKIKNDHQGGLTIGQVAAATGVGRSTLRHWENEFRDFLAAARTDGNQRRFAPDAADRVEKIKMLVEEQGLTLRGVRNELERATFGASSTVVKEPAEPGNPLEEKARRLADLVSDRLMRRLSGE